MLAYNESKQLRWPHALELLIMHTALYSIHDIHDNIFHKVSEGMQGVTSPSSKPSSEPSSSLLLELTKPK